MAEGVPAPVQTAAAAVPQQPQSCAREVLMLLAPEERRVCDARAAAAAALASRGFKPNGGDPALSQMRPEVRQEFDAERARKLARRDVDAGAAQLAEAQADRLRRIPPGLSGRTGAEGMIRVECSIRFSAWKIQGDPKCRLGASAGN